MCVGSQEFADNNPMLVEALISASQEAMDFLNNNPSEAAELLTHQYDGVSTAEIEEQIKAVPFTIDISESAYDTVANLMFEIGAIPESPQKFSELPNYDTIPQVP